MMMSTKVYKEGYDFRISAVLGEAWTKVRGAKSAMWSGLILSFLISFAVCIVLGIVIGVVMMGMGYTPPVHHAGMPVEQIAGGLRLLTSFTVNILAAIVFYPLTSGLIFMGMRRAVDKPLSVTFIFKFYRWKYLIRFIGVSVLFFLIFHLPAFFLGLAKPLALTDGTGLALIFLAISLMLLVVWVYLGVGYALAIPLVLDRLLGSWAAFEASRRAITRHWFKILFVFFWMCVINIVGAALLMIGLIWTIPFSYNVIGILYREIFGVAGKDPVTRHEMHVAAHEPKPPVQEQDKKDG
jgi:hypothetical protein